MKIISISGDTRSSGADTLNAASLLGHPGGATQLKRRKELFELKGGQTLATPGGEQEIGFAKDTKAKTGKSRPQPKPGPVTRR